MLRVSKVYKVIKEVNRKKEREKERIKKLTEQKLFMPVKLFKACIKGKLIFHQSH